jgi:uncharacterized membrane protein
MNNRKNTIFSIIFLFFLSTLIMLRQLEIRGYFCCHMQDTYAFTSRAWQFVEALKEGIIYPGWASLNFWGYGSPAFIFYPPLGYYIVAIFNVFTGSVIAAMNFTKFIALFLSGAGMFFLVREFYSEKIALLTASFYIVFPYNIFQFYLVGTFYSTISVMWFAPVILFTYRYIKDKCYKNVIYAGLCYGGLILTHPINAYMFTFVLTAFIIYMSIIHRRLRDIIVVPLIMTAGFLVSAAYILPIIFEKQFVKIKTFIGEGSRKGSVFDFRNFFILPDMTSKFSPDHLWRAFYSDFVSYVYLFCILVTLSILLMLRLKKTEAMQNANHANKFFIGTALFTIFLQFGISTFVWETVPFFKYIQFAHRWLNITTFAVVFSASIIFRVLRNIYKTEKERKVIIAVTILILSPICVISFLQDYRYIRFAPIVDEQELIPGKPPNWYIVDLPAFVDIDTVDRNDNSKEKVIIMRGEGKVELSKWGSAQRVIEVVASKPLVLRIRTFNFPGWKAYVDGKQTEIRTEEGAGAMLIDIPVGNHTLVIKFKDTAIRYYSKIISLLSFITIVVVSIFSKKKLDKKKPEHDI